MTSSPCTSTSWGRKESPIQTSSLFKSRTKMNTKILVTEISKKSKNQSIEPLKKSKQASDSMMAQPLYARTWHSTATRKVLSPLENKRPENSPLNTKIQPSVKTSGKLHSSVKSETVKTISQSTKSKSLLLQTPSKDSKPSLLSSSLSTTPLLNSQLSTPKPRSQVSAIKAVETPTVRAYEHYLEAKTPTHRSRPIDEDVADQMARLALNCGPKKTPVQLEQRVLARLMSSGKKSRSKTDVFRVEKARSSLLNSPLTWHANKKSDRRRHVSFKDEDIRVWSRRGMLYRALRFPVLSIMEQTIFHFILLIHTHILALHLSLLFRLIDLFPIAIPWTCRMHNFM